MNRERLHFIGIGGVGMSALAQFHAMGGGSATGSDRLIDRGELSGPRSKLEKLGIRLFPQDGSGIDAATSRIVASTAIENDNADLAKARRLGVPILHRSDHLAELVSAKKTLAVSGTSGKSTVTAMIFEILETAALSPSIITGGALLRLEDQGLLGNAARGGSELLVVEADESDGSLVRYTPWLGVLLNIGKDHKEVPALLEMFRTFRTLSRGFVVNGDSPALAEFQGNARTFGFGRTCSVRGSDLDAMPERVRLRVNGVPFELPLDGRHNAENALAAAAACLEVGVPLEASAAALRNYRGIARRFQRLGSAGGILVVDDFAHNPDKIRASLSAAAACAGRVLAVYQPHGYAPTRFLQGDLIAAFSTALRPEDKLWMPEIYYAGGTAAKTISSDDLVAPLAQMGRQARFLADRKDIVADLVKEARPGDMVLVMGARDPSLGAFARSILSALQSRFGRL